MIAHSDTRRLALLVGNNAGARARAALHYAELDAGKIARVLMELGGVDSADLFLLQGLPMKDLSNALAGAKKKIDAWHAEPGNRVLLIFFFSGHSDGEAQHRTWGVDVWTCRCGGQRKVLSVVTSRRTAQEMLLNMGLLAPHSPAPNAQAPPECQLALSV